MAWETGRGLKGIKRLIRNKRETHWVHQSVMADILGITQSMYNKLEVSTASISAERLVLICDRLQIPPNEAFAAIRNSLVEHSKKECPTRIR